MFYDPLLVGITAFLVLIFLLAITVPIGVAMMLCGVGGLAMIIGLIPSLSLFGTTVMQSVVTYDLSIIPLFILMGALASRSGLSQELYDAFNAWLGGFRGGLALATVGACGAFAAICGSSVATAATMSKVALPEMKKYRYSDSMATGSVAAGGIIGILIPPSVILVLYGLLTESSIGDLFIAGFLPGILTILVFMIVISIVTRLHPRVWACGGKIHMETKAKRNPENMGDYGTFRDCDRRYLLWCFHSDRSRRCRGLWRSVYCVFSQTPKPRDDERDIA